MKCANCNTNWVSGGGEFPGICSWCVPIVEKAAMARGLSIVMPPEPHENQERIINGVRFWYWRGKWRASAA